MSKIRELVKKYKELISYVFFGALTTVVSIGTFWLSDRLLGSQRYLISNIISWIAAVLFAYVTNKLWVFESKSRSIKVLAKELVGFFGARLFSLGVEEVGLWLFIDVLSMATVGFSVGGINIDGSMLAKILMQLVVLVLNYVFSKFIIFAKKKSK